MSFYETSDNNGNIYFDLMRKDTRYVINPASKAVIFKQTYNLVDNQSYQMEKQETWYIITTIISNN